MGNKINVASKKDKTKKDHDKKSFFSFEQFVIVAEEILYNGNLRKSNISDESIYRTVLNRAYYACYNHTHEWLDVKYGLKTRVYDEKSGKMKNRRNLSGHVLAYEDLNDISELVPFDNQRKFKNLSRNLKDMFDKRIIADYHLNE